MMVRLIETNRRGIGLCMCVENISGIVQHQLNTYKMNNQSQQRGLYKTLGDVVSITPSTLVQ